MDRRKSGRSTPTAGFTLIELLIVVAIIAILAAIAVPNFLEAQMRSKVSRVQSDLRTLSTALESYRVDTNRYPPTPFVDSPGLGHILRVTPTRLSTPIAYVASAGIIDPFISTQLGDFQAFSTAGVISPYRFDSAVGDPEGGDPNAGQRYYYQSNADPRRISFTPAQQAEAQMVEGMWVLASMGPDKKREYVDVGLITTVLQPYDPSNGTISEGDIIRTQKSTVGTLRP
jgi:type II secretion system protein G